MLMVKALMETVFFVNRASQLFRGIKFAAVNESEFECGVQKEMKAELTAPWRKTANTSNHLKNDNKDFPSFQPPKWLKRVQVDSCHVTIVI